MTKKARKKNKLAERQNKADQGAMKARSEAYSLPYAATTNRGATQVCKVMALHRLFNVNYLDIFRKFLNISFPAFVSIDSG